MIFTVTLNPRVDKTVWESNNEVGRFNQASRITMIAGGNCTYVARVLKNCEYRVHALHLSGQTEGAL